MCSYSDVVDLTAPQAIQEAAGVGGVTGDRRGLVSHSLYRVEAGTTCRSPHHLAGAHIVVDREICGNTGLCGTENECSSCNFV